MRKPDIQAYVQRAGHGVICDQQVAVGFALYVGENVGEGVRGKNTEKRSMV
jgi:hypothetical protein